MLSGTPEAVPFPDAPFSVVLFSVVPSQYAIPYDGVHLGLRTKLLVNGREMGHNQGEAEGRRIENLAKRAVRAAGGDDAGPPA
jgi:hypothetical protein